MTAELIAAFKAPNKYLIARRQLSNLRQQGSVDSYSKVLKSTLYSYQNVFQPTAKARFIKGLKLNTRIYVEERNPAILDAPIVLAKYFDTTQFNRNNQGFGRNSGRFAG